MSDRSASLTEPTQVVFCDVTPRECKHPRVFTRDRQLGVLRGYGGGTSPLPACLLSNDPSNTCDVNWSRGNPPRENTCKGEYKTFSLTFRGPRCWENVDRDGEIRSAEGGVFIIWNAHRNLLYTMIRSGMCFFFFLSLTPGSDDVFTHVSNVLSSRWVQITKTVMSASIRIPWTRATRWECSHFSVKC